MKMHKSNIDKTDRHFLRPWQGVTSIGEAEWTFLGNSNDIYVTDSDGNQLIDGPGGMCCSRLPMGSPEVL